jgi:hypothetical protein
MQATQIPCRMLSSLLAAALAVAPTNAALAAPAPAPTAAPVAEPAPEAEPTEAEPTPEAEPEPEAEAEPEPEPEPAPAPEPAPDPYADRPPEPQIGGKPAKGLGMTIAGATLFAVGAGGTVASVMLTNCPEPASTVGCKYADQRAFAVPLSASVTAAGLLLLLVGIGYQVRYKRWKGWSPDQSGGKGKLKVQTAGVAPTFSRDGFGVGYVARF